MPKPVEAAKTPSAAVETWRRKQIKSKKKIDVFFWQLMPNSKFQEDFTKKLAGSEQFAKKFIVTKPYCAVKASVLLKN